VNGDATERELGATIAAMAPVPQHPALARLVESLREKYGDCVSAVLFYGSCLRSGDPYDGLVDLYLIVNRYRCANSGWLKAAWNWLLPPNVFYTELVREDRVLRCKYAVLSRDDLQKGTSQRWFHSYLWGRFSQPTAIAWCRDDATRERVHDALAQAVLSFLNRVLPGLPAQGQVQALWEGGLRLSYRAELRAEGGARAQQLTRANLAYYQAVTRAAAPLLAQRVEITSAPDGDHYRAEIATPRRVFGRVGWALRIAQGKLLSVARLLKALFTFDGGLDYIAWKLERHSGVPVEIPDKVRRHPLIFVWGLFWKLYRRGVFR
jgi:hypothetical protein